MSSGMKKHCESAQLHSLSYGYHCAQIIYINDDKASLPVSMHTDHISIQRFIAKYFVHICTSEEKASQMKQ